MNYATLLLIYSYEAWITAVSMYLWNTDMYERNTHTQAYHCYNKDMDLLLGKYEYCAVINTLNNSDYLFYSTHKHKGQLLGNIP